MRYATLLAPLQHASASSLLLERAQTRNAPKFIEDVELVEDPNRATRDVDALERDKDLAILLLLFELHGLGRLDRCFGNELAGDGVDRDEGGRSCPEGVVKVSVEEVDRFVDRGEGA